MMDKVQLKPQSMLMPLPATMVSCVAEGFPPNIITISWIGIVTVSVSTVTIVVIGLSVSHETTHS